MENIAPWVHARDLLEMYSNCLLTLLLQASSENPIFTQSVMFDSMSDYRLFFRWRCFSLTRVVKVTAKDDAGCLKVCPRDREVGRPKLLIRHYSRYKSCFFCEQRGLGNALPG